MKNIFINTRETFLYQIHYEYIVVHRDSEINIFIKYKEFLEKSTSDNENPVHVNS